MREPHCNQPVRTFELHWEGIQEAEVELMEGNQVKNEHLCQIELLERRQVLVVYSQQALADAACTEQACCSQGDTRCHIPYLVELEDIELQGTSDSVGIPGSLDRARSLHLSTPDMKVDFESGREHLD